MTGKTNVALVTGASRGIGAASARAFAKAGALVGVMARSRTGVDELAAEIGGLALSGDVAQAADLEDVVARICDRFGRLDVLVNNAGIIGPIAGLAAADVKEWGQAIDINLKGVFHGMRAALPVMRAQGGGTILTVGRGRGADPRAGSRGARRGHPGHQPVARDRGDGYAGQHPEKRDQPGQPA